MYCIDKAADKASSPSPPKRTDPWGVGPNQPDLAGFVVLDGLGGESERGKKTSAGGAGQDHRVPINPRPALMTMATMPAGIATFQPMFISWS